MSFTIGIAGLPNVGKLTLFNALTRATVLAANCPFAAIRPNVGVVSLPDLRLKVLAEMLYSEEVIPATVSFVDTAGIVRGASGGEGPGNQFLANTHEANTIRQVTRVFSDPDVVHVDGKVDSASDIETIQTKLTLADTQILEKQIPRLEKEVRGKKTESIVLETAKETLALLEKGELLPGPAGAALDQDVLKSLQFMTTKPFIFVSNMDQAGMEDETLQWLLRDLVAPAEAIFPNAQSESELVELDEEDARETLEDFGQTEAGLDKLARVGSATSGLQTYLVAGPKEVRAQIIHRGDTTPRTTGVIYTDFQRGFIKTEITPYDDLVEPGGMQEAHATGRIRMEGKDYVMADGDVVELKFNV